jgi:hypothetical protein
MLGPRGLKHDPTGGRGVSAVALRKVGRFLMGRSRGFRDSKERRGNRTLRTLIVAETRCQTATTLRSPVRVAGIITDTDDAGGHRDTPAE